MINPEPLKLEAYRGYTAQIATRSGTTPFYGEVPGLNGAIRFQAWTAFWLEKAFHESVDDYLELCAARSEAPIQLPSE